MFCEENDECDRFSFVMATSKCSTHNEYESDLKHYPGAISGPKYCGNFLNEFEKIKLQIF